jgi:hypothetical protein
VNDPARERVDGTRCAACFAPLIWHPWSDGERAECRCGEAYTTPKRRGWWGVVLGWLLGPAAFLVVSVWKG